MAKTGTIGTSDAVLAAIVPGFGTSASGDVTVNVVQTFLTDSVTRPVIRVAANRLFFNGAYPGPLGGPTGEIGQFADTNYVYEDVANLVFDAAANNLAGYNQQVDILQYLGFSDRKFHDVRNAVFNSFNVPGPSRAALSFNAAATNAFGWNDHEGPGYSALKRVYIAINTFAFSETVVRTESIDVWNTFLFGESLDTLGTDFGSDIGDAGFLRQHVAYRVQSQACPEKQYTPFIGESGDGSFVAVPAAAPTIGQGVLTLTHPRVSPTLTLVLKNPDFGNADVLRFTKIDRRTRGGDRKIFADLGWSTTQSFELEITNLCNANVTIDEILTFLNASLGEEIGLLDWENRQWKGIIVVPETDVTPTVRGHSVKIIFEGELV